MTRRTISMLAFVGLALPAPALAHGVALEVGGLFSGPGESAYRAIASRGNALGEVGLAGHATLWSRGLLRFDATLAWGVVSTQAEIGSALDVSVLQHGFCAGARFGLSLLRYLWPYASLRAGTALGWVDVGPAGSSTADLEAFALALRAEPSLGVEGFLPFRAFAGGFGARDETAGPESGRSSPGVGMGLEVGYRFQTPFSFDAEPPKAEDDEVARDAIDRDGTSLGELSLEGLRIGFSIFARF